MFSVVAKSGARVAGKAIGRAAGNAAMNAAPQFGNGLKMAGKAAGIVGGITTGLKATDLTSQFALGQAMGDKHMITKSIFGTTSAIGEGVFPGVIGDSISEGSDMLKEHTLKELEERGEQPKIDEDIGKPIGEDTVSAMENLDTALNFFPGLGALSPISAALSGNNIMGRFNAVRALNAQNELKLQNDRAEAQAARDQESAAIAAQFAIDHPEIDKLNKQAETDAQHPGFARLANLGKY